MLKGKSLLDYTNLFSPIKYEENDRITLKYSQQILKRLRLKKYILLFVLNIKNLKTVKDHTFLIKQ